MRILFADRLPDQARVRLASSGFEVGVETGLSGDALTAHLGSFDPHVLVVRSTRVGPAQIAACKALSLVVRAGAGVDTIDLGACSSHGIYVANCPGKNAVAVAELTLGLILALDRQIPACTADLRAGRWDKGRYSKARGLYGRTLGIIGLGDIGMEVARRAASFGMEVLAWSRSLTDERAVMLGLRSYPTPEDVARRAEVLTVHLAQTQATKGFIGESIFKEMKHGAFFVNTSRAGIVDEDALLRALDEKGIHAGLDVFEGEPSQSSGPFTSKLASHPQVVGTHHIGASTEQAQLAVADEACRIIETYRTTGRTPNCVNLLDSTAADWCLVVRHRDEVGVLAAVLNQLRRAKLNVQEMENTVFAGARAASARIQIAGEPPAKVVAAIAATEHVLHVDTVAIEPRRAI